MEKQLNIFDMQDVNAEEFDDNLSFLLKTDCPKEELEEISKNADLIWHDYEKEDLDEEYRQFVPNLYGLSKYDIMKEIVKQKGYIWEEVSFPTVEW